LPQVSRSPTCDRNESRRQVTIADEGPVERSAAGAAMQYLFGLLVVLALGALMVLLIEVYLRET
jgi:hypothetical protein